MPKTPAPTGWRWVPLTNVARLESGHTPSRRHPEYWGGDIGWLSIRDAKANHGKVVTETIETTNEIGIENSSARVLPGGTVCLSRTASVGYVTIMGHAMATSQDFVNWVCSDKLDPRFLQYLLIHEKPSLARFSSGAVHQTIYFPEVKAFHVCIPAIEEQRRIVAILDEAFAAIVTATANAEMNLANVRELARTTLLAKTRERSTQIRKLGEVGIVDWGNTNLTKSAYIEGGSALAVSAAGCDGRIGHAEHQAGVPVLSAIGARCGRMFFPEEPFTAIKNTITITPRPGEADGKFLFHLLSSVDLPRRGAAQPFIAKGDINKFEVPFPRLEDQRLLVTEIDSMFALCDRLAAANLSRLLSFVELKKALLYRAFIGELSTTFLLAANDDWTKPAFTAQVIALAYRRHLAIGTEATYGRVKAQKVLHLVESVGGVDLGRNPVKDAAGPNDFQHMLAAENWAKANQFFEFVLRPTGIGYSFKKLSRFNALIAEGAAAMKPVQDRLNRVTAIIAPLNSEQAELLATAHAAWNNLLLDNVEPTEAAIIHEARENWHFAKQKFGDGKFRQAIAAIRAERIEPDGSAKRVGGQEALLL